MNRSGRFASAVALISLSSLLSAPLLASAPPPDLEFNPETGFVESVDIAVDSGNAVRHVEDEGQGGGRVATLVSTGAGANPRIAIRSNGESWIVWWRNTSPGEILYVRRDPTTREWTSETTLGTPGEDSRNPEIVHNGSETWVAYEIKSGGSATQIAATGIIDSPEPFPTRCLIATTSFAGDVDVLVQSISGHVWVTWVDSAAEVGWSEYDHASGLWSVPQYEPLAGRTLEVVRKIIKLTVAAP